MQGKKKKDFNTKLFPLKRFSKIGLYDLAYLSLLVQRGKLKAQRVGRNYFTSIEWFEEYLKEHSRKKNVFYDRNKIFDQPNRFESKRIKKSKNESLSKGEVNNLNRFLDNTLKEKKISLSEKNIEPVIVPKIGGSELQADHNLNIIKRQKRIDYRIFQSFKKALIFTGKSFSYSFSQIFYFIKQAIIFPIALLGSFLFLFFGLLIGIPFQIFKKIYEFSKIIFGKSVNTNLSIKAAKGVIRLNYIATSVILVLIFMLFASFSLVVLAPGAGASVLAKVDNIFDINQVTNKAGQNIDYFEEIISNKVFSLKNNINKRNNVLKMKIDKASDSLTKTSSGIKYSTNNLYTYFTSNFGKFKKNINKRNIVLKNRIFSLEESVMFSFDEKIVAIEKDIDQIYFNKKEKAQKNIIYIRQSIKRPVDNISSKISKIVSGINNYNNKFFNEISRRNQILARRINGFGDGVKYIYNYWIDKSKSSLAATRNNINNFKNKSVSLFNDSSDLVKDAFVGFGNNSIARESRMKNVELMQFPKVEGRVLGVSEKLENNGLKEKKNNSKISYFQNTIVDVTDSTVESVKLAFNKLSQGQQKLASSLGNKFAIFTIESAGKVKGVSEAGSVKLAQMGDVVEKTNQSIDNYQEKGKTTFSKELDRSIWSLGDIYTKIIDFFVPDKLKEKYADVYSTLDYQNNDSFVEQEKTREEPVKQIVEIRTERVIEKIVVDSPNVDESYYNNNENVDEDIDNTLEQLNNNYNDFVSRDLILDSLVVKDSTVLLGETKIENMNFDENTEVTDKVDIKNAKIGDLDVTGTIMIAGYTLPSSPGVNGQVLKMSSDGSTYWGSDMMGGGGGTTIISSGGGGGSGTVTSVAMTVPTGLTVSGSPITTSGTLGLSLDTGYEIPTAASSTNWSNFYYTPSNRIVAGTNLSWSGNTLNATGGSGSGTVNYGEAGALAFYSSSGTTATGTAVSNLFWDNSNNRLGIGSSTPWQELSINGDLAITGGLYDINNSLGTNGMVLQSDGSNLNWVATSSLGIVSGYWTQLGSDVYYNTGNVAIGTSTPSSKMTVWGDGTSGLTTFNVVDSASSTLFTVLDNGRVGIGSTTPSHTLGILDSENDYLGYMYNTNTGASAGGLYIQSDGDGNLLNLNASGSDILTVSEAQTVINNPVTMASAGDVSMAYDLIMTNSTAGYMKFEGPGYIQTDSTWQNLDLTLSAANLGDVVIDDTAVITGTTSIASLAYINNNTQKVGIGTSSPYSKLTVWGDGSSGLSTFTVVNSASSTLFSVLDNGNIGIGTTSPAVTLDIYATDAMRLPVGTTAQRPTGGTGMLRYNTTTSQFEGYGGSAWTGLGGVIDVDSDTYILAESSAGADEDALFFNTGGSERMRLTSTGDLGVGTSTPYAKLSVWGDGTSGLTAFNVVDSASSTLFSVLDNGNIGIGTTSPAVTLDIYATDAMRLPVGTTAQRPSGDTGMLRYNSTTSQFEGYGGSAWTGLGGVIDADGDTYILAESSAGADEDDLFFFAGGSEIGRFDSTGNLGIASSSPDSLLTVYSNGSKTGGLFHIATTTTEVLYAAASGNIGMGVIDPDSKLEIMDTGTQLKLSYNDSVYSTITTDSSGILTLTGNSGNGGNVIIDTGSRLAIGTTTPDSLFFITHDGSNRPMMRVASSTDTAFYDYLHMDSQGKLALGTSSPSSMLDIYDNGTVSQAGITIRDYSTVLTGPGIAFFKSHNNDTNILTTTIDNEDLGVIGGFGVTSSNIHARGARIKFIQDGTAGASFIPAEISFETSDGTTEAAQRMVIGSDGYLGIGTTSPEVLFTVGSSTPSQVSGYRDAFFAGDLEVDGLLYVQGSGNSVVDSNLYVNGLVTFNQNGLGSDSHYFYENSESGIYLMRGASGNNNIKLSALAGDDSYVSTPNSNFAIGTTTPSSKLTVWGDGNSDDSAFNVINNASSTLFSVLENGKVGVGTTSPAYQLSVVKISPDEDEVIFGISTSTNGTIFTVDEDGDIAYDGTASSPAADYAEYYFTHDLDLEPGETVCIDTTEENAVKRCIQGSDGNVMGIISTKPAIVGNSKVGYDNNPNYVIVGMLGQVPAKVSDENGQIRPGDSLTSASSISGVAMRANAGDPTVGIALERLDGKVGEINVLISRRNKSLTVSEVEDKVTERVAAMEIEDEVNILIADAIDTLNLDDEINNTVDPKLLLLETKLTVKTDDISGDLVNVQDNIAVLADSLANLQGRVDEINNWKIDTENKLSNLYIDNLGNIKMGQGINDNLVTSTGVAVVEISTLDDSNQTAFVVNQEGSGNIADFRADKVSVMNINNEGKVSVVGNLLVDGRIMTCSGGACGEALENAVDETMGDMGVEGKVVAGAFEGYCDDGFVWVPGSSKYGTMPGFCVMTHKAREEMNKEADIWSDVSLGEAQIACQSLSSSHHLISENEWLTISENIVKVGANDQDELIDGMQLALDENNNLNYYLLDNGNEIYEFGLGTGEWTDRLVTKSGCPNLAEASWNEYGNVLDYYGLEIAPPYYMTHESNGIGLIQVGDNSSNLRGFVRGINGIYSLDLSYPPTYATSTIGFRCAK